MKRIYLDYAATTPVAPAVLAAMQPYFDSRFGNAGSLHSFGQEAMAAVDESREKIARAIGADFREIIFTSGATEANNLAIKGVIAKLQNCKIANKNSAISNPRIIVSTIEHESILETVRDLEKDGIEVVHLRVDKNGLIDLRQLKKELDERTILVSIVYANNEIGTLEPIKEISKIIQDFKKESDTINRIGARFENNRFGNYPLFHTDGVQAFQYLDCGVKNLGVDLMTLSGHKIYGPKGVGALYVRQAMGDEYGFALSNEDGSRVKKLITHDSLLRVIITGGGQEFGLRSGTENVPLMVGFAKAVEIVAKGRRRESKRISELQNYFWKQIKKICPKAELNGPALNGNRLPNNLNIYFLGHKSDELLIEFDLAGVAVSAGSACSARGTESSHVLRACGFPLERIKSSLRITLGRPTTKAEIGEAARRIKSIIKN